MYCVCLESVHQKGGRELGIALLCCIPGSEVTIASENPRRSDDNQVKSLAAPSSQIATGSLTLGTEKMISVPSVLMRTRANQREFTVPAD